MIQRKAKNKYWQAGRKWQIIKDPADFNRLDFEDYKYIIGDTIYTEPSDDARKAFKTVQVWMQLQ